MSVDELGERVGEQIGELLGAGLPPGWRAEPCRVMPDGTLEWEVVAVDGGGSQAPIENYLLRVPPGGGVILLLFDNCDAGVGGIHQLAPQARVLPMGERGRLPELLRRVVGIAPPDRFGLT